MQDSNIDRDNLVYANCIICGSDRFRKIHEIEISPLFTPSYLVRCEGCNLFYANPRLNRRAEEDYYKRRYHEIQEDGYWYNARIALFRRAVRVIDRYAHLGRLVDIGCGMGYFMDLARKRGWEVKGVEVSEYALRHAKDELGLDVKEGSLEEAHFETEYFDAATMWNVLDQIYDPKTVLMETKRILKKGGYIFIRISNLRFHLKLFKIWNSCAVFHLYSFDKDSIKNLLEIAGFSDVVVKTELLNTNVPVRKIFDAVGKIINLISFGKVIMSPSIFVIAKKEG